MSLKFVSIVWRYEEYESDYYDGEDICTADYPELSQFGRWMCNNISHIRFVVAFDTLNDIVVREVIYTFYERDIGAVRSSFPNLIYTDAVVPNSLIERGKSYPDDDRWRYCWSGRIVADANIATIWRLRLGGDLDYRPLAKGMPPWQYAKLCERYGSRGEREETAPSWEPGPTGLQLDLEQLRSNIRHNRSAERL